MLEVEVRLHHTERAWPHIDVRVERFSTTPYLVSRNSYIKTQDKPIFIGHPLEVLPVHSALSGGIRQLLLL